MGGSLVDGEVFVEVPAGRFLGAGANSHEGWANK